jgi:hypothetical protein
MRAGRWDLKKLMRRSERFRSLERHSFRVRCPLSALPGSFVRGTPVPG